MKRPTVYRAIISSEKPVVEADSTVQACIEGLKEIEKEEDLDLSSKIESLEDAIESDTTSSTEERDSP